MGSDGRGQPELHRGVEHGYGAKHGCEASDAEWSTKEDTQIREAVVARVGAWSIIQKSLSINRCIDASRISVTRVALLICPRIDVANLAFQFQGVADGK